MENFNHIIRLNIMLHDDWEIYGDGSGNPEKLMFEPAKKILDICDRFDAKYTFYAEFGQQLSMLNSNIKQHRLLANKWEDVLKDAISRGHDVQLHFHPQWIGSSFRNGKWNLDFSNWAITKLNEQEIYNWLKQGKDYLENLLTTVKPDYRVVSFRAGGWFNQPSENLYNALVKLGIKADVSVRKGIKRDFGKSGLIDFSNAPSELKYWVSDPEDFAKESVSNSKMISIPTYSKSIPDSIIKYIFKNYFATLPHYLQFMYKMRAKNGSHYTPNVVEQSENSLYCNFGLYHYKMINDLIKTAIDLCIENNYVELPFVMLTHSKSFYSYKNFGQILKNLKDRKNIKFVTTQNQVEQLFLN